MKRNITQWLFTLASTVFFLPAGHAKNLSAGQNSDASEKVFTTQSFFQLRTTALTGYFGQQPPGQIPKLFLPDVVFSETYSETGCTFTADGKELFFTRSGHDLDSPAIFSSRFRDNMWSQPKKAKIEGFGAHISPSGKRIFVSRFGYDEQNQRTVELWFAEREGERWTDLRYHGPGSRPSLSDSGNLYYIDRSDTEDRGVIVVQQFVDGKYLKPEIVGGGVNTSAYEAHPCMARNESYIIFDSNRPGGYGEGDLYVCFRNDDGEWGDAHNLGPTINTEAYEAYSSISPDGKFLFYSSNKNGTFDLFWVNLDIIEDVRP